MHFGGARQTVFLQKLVYHCHGIHIIPEFAERSRGGGQNTVTVSCTRPPPALKIQPRNSPHPRRAGSLWNRQPADPRARTTVRGSWGAPEIVVVGNPVPGRESQQSNDFRSLRPRLFAAGIRPPRRPGADAGGAAPPG